MDMVQQYIRFQYFNLVFLLTETVDLLSYILGYLILKHAIPIFWTEDDMILALVY